jgi:GH24 family phage-related lysozyme (muramidase)
MKLSNAGLDLLKRSEGFRGFTYRDVAGIPTIGYGHRILPGETFPAGITEVQGSTILLADVKIAEDAVTRLVTVTISQGQFDALVDFTFNLGAGRLAGSTLLRCLNGGNDEAAGEQLLRWDIAAGVENAGLKARREAELALWNE